MARACFGSALVLGLACSPAPQPQSSVASTPAGGASHQHGVATGCGSHASASEADTSVVPIPAAPCDCAPAEPASSVAATATPPATETAASDEVALGAEATGPATGGPTRGNHRCEFRESVDTYSRQCKVTLNADGSLQVTAAGTTLNPDNGFDFTLHRGPYDLVAKGTLNAFSHCAGPFLSRAQPVIEGGVKTFELRFKEHCMIVIR